MTDSPEEFDEEEEEQEVPPGPEVTPELFREWHSPRYGQSNPERMNNPVWEWLIRSRISAYSASKEFKGQFPFDLEPGWSSTTLEDGRKVFVIEPGWSFQRFGQSSTALKDGRRVLIGGEHEDYSMPDFFIYNDVVVRHPDDRIDIYGYPKDVFPPTDSHTATLVGDRIIIIGCIGYPDQRRHGATPVFTLDLDGFSISQVATSGAAPGWIYKHSATLSEDGNSILIERGKIEHDSKERSDVENPDDWRLHLADWRWERMTERRWQQWKITRKDQKPNHVWEVKSAVFAREMRWEKECEEEVAKLTQKYGKEPDLDLVSQLFRPKVVHEPLPEVEGEYGVVRIKVDGVIIRYVESSYSIRMTVEGELPQATIDALTADLIEKLSTLENTPYERKQL